MKSHKAIIVASLIFIFFIASGCDNGIDSEYSVTFQKLSFTRAGGGDKIFFATLSSNPHQINLEVVRYNFRDTVYHITVTADDTLSGLYNVIDSTLSGKMELKGNFVQPSELTGTWVFIYVVDTENESVEITNESLRNRLLLLEGIVEGNRKNN